jgi:hypothetical protein
MAGERVVPQARKDGLIVRELGEEVLVYDLERHRAYCLNPMAAWVWRHCDGRTSVEALARKMAEVWGVPADATWVEMALERLGRARLLVGQWESLGVRLGRREFLKRLAIAGLLGPVVSRLTAPLPAQAQTCIPPEQCRLFKPPCPRPLIRCCGIPRAFCVPVTPDQCDCDVIFP